MSEIQKCPNLVRGGGGQHFSKMSQIQKCPKCQRVGVNPNWDIVPNFTAFYGDASPYQLEWEKYNFYSPVKILARKTVSLEKT